MRHCVPSGLVPVVRGNNNMKTGMPTAGYARFF